MVALLATPGAMARGHISTTDPPTSSVPEQGSTFVCRLRCWIHCKHMAYRRSCVDRCRVVVRHEHHMPLLSRWVGFIRSQRKSRSCSIGVPCQPPSVHVKTRIPRSCAFPYQLAAASPALPRDAAEGPYHGTERVAQVQHPSQRNEMLAQNRGLL